MEHLPDADHHPGHEDGHDPRHRLGAHPFTWIVAVGLLITVAAFQQIEVRSAPQVAEIERPSTDLQILMGRLTVGIDELSPAQSGQYVLLQRQMAQSQVEKFRAALVEASVASPQAAAGSLAVVREDLEAMLAEADAEPPPPDSPAAKKIALVEQLVRDVRTAQTVMDEGADGATSEDLDALRDRHGWFASLALEAVESEPPAETVDGAASATPAKALGKMPVRTQAADSGKAVFALLLLFGLLFFVAIVTGLTLLIIALVQLSRGRMFSRFVPPPARGGRPAPERARSAAHAAHAPVQQQIHKGHVQAIGHAPSPERGVWLETFCVFALGFLLLKLGSDALAGSGPGAPMRALWMGLIGQWLLAVTIFWPLVRGMRWRQFRYQLGWHRGRGVLTEIGCGLGTWLAWLPIQIMLALLMMGIGLAVELVRSVAAGGVADDRLPVIAPQQLPEVVNLLAAGNLPLIITLALLVVVWAPVVEEAIFRGSVYRHMRGRFGFFVSALLASMAFALMHGYLLMQVVLVGSLGFAFAVLREWRGSLIPCMTAHFAQNSMALTVMIVLLKYASA